MIGDRHACQRRRARRATPARPSTSPPSTVIPSFTLGGGAAGGLVGIAGAHRCRRRPRRAPRHGSGGRASDRETDDIGVIRLAKKDVLTLAISAAGGFVGISASISVWSIGAVEQRHLRRRLLRVSRDPGTWSSGTLYKEGDIVTVNGQKYVLFCAIWTEGETPPDSATTRFNGYQPDQSTDETAPTVASPSLRRIHAVDSPTTRAPTRARGSSGTTYNADDVVSRRLDPSQDPIRYRALKTRPRVTIRACGARSATTHSRPRTGRRRARPATRPRGTHQRLPHDHRRDRRRLRHRARPTLRIKRARTTPSARYRDQRAE